MQGFDLGHRDKFRARGVTWLYLHAEGRHEVGYSGLVPSIDPLACLNENGEVYCIALYAVQSSILKGHGHPPTYEQQCS